MTFLATDYELFPSHFAAAEYLGMRAANWNYVGSITHSSSTNHMKSKLRKILTAAVIFGAALAAPAFAISFTDTSGTATFLNTTSNDGYGNSVSGVLDITTGNPVNYNPATMVLTSATIKFAFADTNDPTEVWWQSDGNEVVSVTLDSTFFQSSEVSGTHAAFDWTSIAGNLSGTIFSNLQSDGKLNYTVTITSGDVWFKGAQLDAVGNLRTNTPGVPDSGSTVAFLGLALVGLAVIKRRS